MQQDNYLEGNIIAENNIEIIFVLYEIKQYL